MCQGPRVGDDASIQEPCTEVAMCRRIKLQELGIGKAMCGAGARGTCLDIKYHTGLLQGQL